MTATEPFRFQTASYLVRIGSENKGTSTCAKTSSLPATCGATSRFFSISSTKLNRSLADSQGREKKNRGTRHLRVKVRGRFGGGRENRS